MSKPIIGITCDYDFQKQTSQLYRGYYDAVMRAGGLPFLIANIGKDIIPELIGNIDGILFTGGQDVDPMYFGEPPNPKLGAVNPYRDELEIPLCRQAMDDDIPILGICRGIQVMNIAMGGIIYQDLESQWSLGTLQKHSQLAPDWYGSHQVSLESGSKLSKMMGSEILWTNSFHHQAISVPAGCFDVVAMCGDGVIEGIESSTHTFALGVQWHPERMWERDEKMFGLFKGLVSAARPRR